jgi:nitrite reductase/ring-hydroxylating ferredoxin subunit
MVEQRRGHIVCRSEELAPGGMKAVRIGGRRVVVVRARNGSLHALASTCLHQGAPLDQGRLYDRVAAADRVGDYHVAPDREVLKCPWHGYEYDVRTGETTFDNTRALPTYEVTEDGDHIIVHNSVKRRPPRVPPHYANSGVQ